MGRVSIREYQDIHCNQAGVSEFWYFNRVEWFTGRLLAVVIAHHIHSYTENGILCFKLLAYQYAGKCTVTVMNLGGPFAYHFSDWSTDKNAYIQ